LQTYLQRVFGYALTAEIRDHAMFFLFGPGGNGKGTFIDTLYEIMGDYATGVPISALMKSNRDRHSTEIYKLLGHRLAVASETESGREWDESRIKYLTGGDPLTARPMRRDFITFPPTHKLFVVGNNQPKLGNVDDAARRRFHMIPFTKKIPQPDKLLREKLRREYPAIFRWGIGGTIAWQQEGLNPPPAVLASTQEYFDDQDVVGRWIEERCELLPTVETLNKDLHHNFVAWAQENGDDEALPGKDTFLTQLRRLPGVTRAERSKAGRGLKGIRLRTPAPVRDAELLGREPEMEVSPQSAVVSKRVN
jgi:putative DNA primase/helicase